MDASVQIVFNIVLSIAAFAVGFLVHLLWGAIHTLQRDFNAFQIKVAEEYVSTKELHEVEARLTTAMKEHAQGISDLLKAVAGRRLADHHGVER